MSLSCYLIMKTPLPRKFNTSFLKNSDNKERLNLYCADKFHSNEEEVQSFNITKGESVLSNSILDESISINTAEEADQKLFWQMIQCVRSASNANVLHFNAFNFASVSEVVSTNLLRVYSLISSDFVDFSGVFIVCKYCYSLLKSSW